MKYEKFIVDFVWLYFVIKRLRIKVEIDNRKFVK